MNTAPIKPVPASPQAEALWSQIVQFTREACVLRQEEREAEAAGLLQEKLPPLIRSWSAGSGLSPDACRQRLRELFAAEQERVKTAVLYRRLVVDEVCSRLEVRSPHTAVPASRAQATLKVAPGRVQLRRRVPIDDVVGMLDALRDAERTEIAEAILPVRSVVRSSFSAESRTLTAGLAG